MPLAESKVTSQGQTSVPREVRRKLGIGPGSTLSWEEDGDAVIVRKAGRATSKDVHRAVFPEGPPSRHSLDDLKEGVRKYIRKRHARG